MAVYTDFSSLLAGATIICGAIWAIDSLIFKKRRLKAQGVDAKEPKLVDFARSFFPLLLVVCVLRSFIAEPFRIPSGSMKPSLLEGDFILVNKFIYGIRLPLLGNKIIDVNEPKHADVIVFRYPKDTSVNFIKRIVGVPGDKISYRDKVLYINGKPMSQELVGAHSDMNEYQQAIPVKQYTEDLDNHRHAIYIVPHRPAIGMPEVTVPEGMYFVMGDNRDNSEDSRAWGFVPESLILGKAFFVWMSWDHLAKDVRWKRIGQAIKS